MSQITTTMRSTRKEELIHALRALNIGLEKRRISTKAWGDNPTSTNEAAWLRDERDNKELYDRVSNAMSHNDLPAPSSNSHGDARKALDFVKEKFNHLQSQSQKLGGVAAFVYMADIEDGLLSPQEVAEDVSTLVTGSSSLAGLTDMRQTSADATFKACTELIKALECDENVQSKATAANRAFRLDNFPFYTLWSDKSFAFQEDQKIGPNEAPKEMPVESEVNDSDDDWEEIEG